MSNGDLTPIDEQTLFLLYGDDNNKVRVRVLIREETIWLSQKLMAELFDVSIPTINEHLKNIFESKELEQDSVIRKFRTTAADGKNYETNFYNLDAIISVGYRVNSVRATQFRQWATQILKEYIKKGFVMDDERLKLGEQTFGQDYFRELLERVRSIRASERKIYQQITDVFAECSVDYDSKSDTTKNFYAMMQNKFHFAITGHTAAEIIYEKADHKAPYMGLLTWKNAPAGRVLLSDVTIAKNYLSEPEIKKLERTISGFFDYIENIIENRVQMTMQDMAYSVDKFLSFNEYKVLIGKGGISKTQADEKALTEYKIFNKTQKIESDFDRTLKQLEKRVIGKKPRKIKDD